MRMESAIATLYNRIHDREQWLEDVEHLAQQIGARGVNLIESGEGGIVLTSSPAARQITSDFVQSPFARENTRVSRLLDRFPHPAFMTDSCLHTEDELKGLPLYREFLNPRGAAAGAATIIQGIEDDAVIFAFEAFGSHAQSRRACRFLGRLRPHLMRAYAVQQQFEAIQSRSLLDVFDACRIGVALLGAEGRVMGVNERFRAMAEGLAATLKPTLRMNDLQSQGRYADGLVHLQRSGEGCTVALRDARQAGAAVLHLIPAPAQRFRLRGLVAVALINRPTNRALPAADIIAALYDLTPGEARVSRLIAKGRSVGEVAGKLGVQPETIRTHLKRIYQKTSVAKQSELAALLSWIG